MSEKEGVELEGVPITKPEFPSKNRLSSVEKILKAVDSQISTKNLFSNTLPKFGNLEQAHTSSSTITVTVSRNSLEDLETKTNYLKSSIENKEKDSFTEFPVKSSRKISHFISDELERKSMDIRRHLSDSNKNVVNKRNTADLERRRLEAELKAAEEIAKIRQVVIEKRLALELASLENGLAYQKIQTFQATPQSDLMMFEEMARRQQIAIENSLANELNTLEHISRPQSTRSVPPSVPSRQYSVEKEKLVYLNPDNDYFSSSSKNVKKVQPDTRRRNSLDFRTPPLMDFKAPLPQNQPGPADVRYAPSTEVRFVKHTDESNFLHQEQPEGNPEEVHGNKVRFAWKSMMNKIKKKFHSSKPSEGWE